jgi:hypothetical protein
MLHKLQPAVTASNTAGARAVEIFYAVLYAVMRHNSMYTSQKLATAVGPVFPGVVTPVPAGVMKPHYTGTTPAVHLLV